MSGSQSIIITGLNGLENTISLDSDFDPTTHEFRLNSSGGYDVVRRENNTLGSSGATGGADVYLEAVDVASSGVDIMNPNAPITLATQAVGDVPTVTTVGNVTTITPPESLTDKDKLRGSGVYFNHLLGKVDENIKDIVYTNAGKYKISTFFVPKFDLKLETISTDKDAIFLNYNQVVKKIVLEDDVDSIGLKGYIEIDNIGSHIDMWLGRHNNYYLVIAFTKYRDEAPKDGFFGEETVQVKYLPYIFDIQYVENLSSPEIEEKRLRIGLVDIMTSILRTHSIASVIKFDNSLTTSRSYKEVFRKILDYIKNYIKVNTNNIYLYKKDLVYTDTLTCYGDVSSGNDADAAMQGLIKASFSKIARNATVYLAVQQLLKDACTTLKTPKRFSDLYMTIGDVLIPFFFKEEYPDPQMIYSILWRDDVLVQENVSNDAVKPENANAAASSAPPQAATEVKPTTLGSDPADPQTQPVATEEGTATTDEELGESSGDSSSSDSSSGVMASSSSFVRSLFKGVTDNLTPTTSGTMHQEALNYLSDWQSSIRLLPQFSEKHDNNVVEYLSTEKAEGVKMLCRQMTMRDIFMPFYVAFGDEKYSGVYEDINPPLIETEEDNTVPLLKRYRQEIKSMQFDPIDINDVRKIWKNTIFLDTSGGANCANSTLIFFSWFFDFYQEVFLNVFKRFLISNVMPNFFMVSRNYGINHAKKEGNTFENKFDEYNSYTYATETDDTVNECLRLMGKNLASFTLINDMYTFTLNGDLMRRPNEIIRFGYRGNQLYAGMDMLSMHTDINFGEFTYLYVRRVRHIFSGSTYDNEIVGCKLCEVMKDITPEQRRKNRLAKAQRLEEDRKMEKIFSNLKQ